MSGDSRCTTIRKVGELLSTVTPSLRTSSGNRAEAVVTRFCTSTCALSRSVPSLKVTSTFRLPSAVDWEVT